MTMALAKAKQVLSEYKKSDYNASKALQNAGYKQSTALHQSKPVLNSAIKRVAKEQLKTLVTSSNPLASLFEVVGISENEVLEEYTKILKQDKDISTKLKALLPLLATKGIKWNEEEAKTKAPQLNITIKDNVITPKDKPLDLPL